MTLLLAILVGLLFAVGVYLMLRRSLVKLLLGLALVGHAANLMVFVAGGLVRAEAPLVLPGATAPPAGHADPVPQALVLTAIVIGFALVSFAAVLLRSVLAASGSDDGDAMRGTE